MDKISKKWRKQIAKIALFKQNSASEIDFKFKLSFVITKSGNQTSYDIVMNMFAPSISNSYSKYKVKVSRLVSSKLKPKF